MVPCVLTTSVIQPDDVTVTPALKGRSQTGLFCLHIQQAARTVRQVPDISTLDWRTATLGRVAKIKHALQMQLVDSGWKGRHNHLVCDFWLEHER